MFAVTFSIIIYPFNLTLFAMVRVLFPENQYFYKNQYLVLKPFINLKKYIFIDSVLVRID